MTNDPRPPRSYIICCYNSSINCGWCFGLGDVMTIELQAIPPTRFPVCPDCGHQIDSYGHGCLSQYRAWHAQATKLKEDMPELFEAKAASTATEIAVKHREAMDKLFVRKVT